MLLRARDHHDVNPSFCTVTTCSKDSSSPSLLQSFCIEKKKKNGFKMTQVLSFPSFPIVSEGPMVW